MSQCRELGPRNEAVNVEHRDLFWRAENMRNVLASTVRIALAAGLFSLCWEDSRADEQRQNEPNTVLSLAKHIDGRTSPQDVPYDVKYAHFFRRYDSAHRYALGKDISASDDAILSNVSANEANWKAREHYKYQSDFVEICSNWQGKDAITIALETDRAASDSNGRRAAMYRDTLDSLSEHGRQSVVEFVEATVTPAIKLSITKNEDFAKADPEWFMDWLEVRCHRVLTGVYPEEIQRARDEFHRQHISKFGAPSESGGAVTFEAKADNKDDADEEDE